MKEISLVDAARLLDRQPSTIAKLAREARTEAGARRLLAQKFLPGRRVGRFWLFQPVHVRAFGLIKRPVGRPANA